MLLLLLLFSMKSSTISMFFRNVSFPRRKSTTNFWVSPFSRGKVTMSIGRETKPHILPNKINKHCLMLHIISRNHKNWESEKHGKQKKNYRGVQTPLAPRDGGIGLGTYLRKTMIQLPRVGWRLLACKNGRLPRLCCCCCF